MKRVMLVVIAAVPGAPFSASCASGLKGHRRNSKLVTNKSVACLRIHGAGGGAAKRKKTGQQQELQKEQRDTAVWLALDASQGLTGKFLRDRAR